MNIDFFQCTTRAEVLKAIACCRPILVAFDPKRVTDEAKKRQQRQDIWSREQDVMVLGRMLSKSSSRLTVAQVSKLIGRTVNAIRSKQGNFTYLLSDGQKGRSNCGSMDEKVHESYRTNRRAFWAEYASTAKRLQQR